MDGLTRWLVLAVIILLSLVSLTLFGPPKVGGILVLLLFSIPVAYLLRRRFPTSDQRRPGLRRDDEPLYITGGLVLFLLSFVWLFVAGLVFFAQPNVVFLPFFLMFGMGWFLLLLFSGWVHRHGIQLAFCGAFFLLLSAGWFLISHGHLAPASGEEKWTVYAVVLPLLSLVAVGASMVTTPIFVWYLRTSGAIRGD